MNKQKKMGKQVRGQQRNKSKDKSNKKSRSNAKFKKILKWLKSKKILKWLMIILIIGSCIYVAYEQRIDSGNKFSTVPFITINLKGYGSIFNIKINKKSTHKRKGK